MRGTSVRPRAPPKAVPFQTRPVTSWNGRVAISWPAPATPMIDELAPAAMAALERLAHQLDVADALEAVVGAAAGELDQVRAPDRRRLRRVDEVGEAEAARDALARGVEVDADDRVGAGQPRALHDVEADAAQAEDDDVGAGLDLGREDDRADAGGDAAADVADLVEGRVLADLGDRDLRQHRVLRKGRAAHVVVDRLLADAEAAGAVGHEALALRRANGGAQVGLAAEARFALAALGRVERDDVVALARRW